ncbi:MAG TPA: hypothetical protein VJ085_08080, partial [Candidatus Acidoferrales bacterium]|nr:hypothetical protein [Candidatus Acidoferrales bacterium]
WGLAVWGSFQWNALLSAVARLLIYGTTCAALLVFRQRNQQDAFRLPAGAVWSLAGMAFCLGLLPFMGRGELLVLGITALLASATWWWARRRAAGRA